LLVGYNLSVARVNTWRGYVIAVARLEGSIDISSRNIVRASNAIKVMLAQGGTIGSISVASLETENAATKEHGPLSSLTDLTRELSEQPFSIEETAEGIATLVRTVGVQLTAKIARLKVDLSLVDKASDLNVRLGLDELNTLESALRNESAPVAWLGTPRDLDSFSIADGLVSGRGAEQTKVCHIVDDSSLTH
jgi:hypothetical protein